MCFNWIYFRFGKEMYLLYISFFFWQCKYIAGWKISAKDFWLWADTSLSKAYILHSDDWEGGGDDSLYGTRGTEGGDHPQVWHLQLWSGIPFLLLFLTVNKQNCTVCPLAWCFCLQRKGPTVWALDV